MAQFRAQSVAKPAWEFNPNNLVGLEDAVHNNQTQLAMEYVNRLVHDMKADIEDLKLEIVRLTTTAAKGGTRSKADTE